MIPILKWLFLGAYWSVLTRSLLMTCPWELFSKTLAENPPFDLSFEPISWVAHLSAYTVLGLLINQAASEKKKLLVGLFILAFFHSIACELLQHFIPGRWPNVWDAVSNTLGLMLALILSKASQQLQILGLPYRY